MTAGEPAPGSPAAARGERGAAGPTPATGPRPDLPATGPRPDFTTADAAAGRATLVFATRLNLIRLAASGSSAAAMAAARAAAVVTVEPAFVDLPEGPHMRIAADAGYGQ